MLEYLLTGILTVGMSALATYFVGKRLISRDRMLNFAEDFLFELSQNKEMQQQLYMAGGILGNGIKAGVGLTARSGKPKLEDIIMGLIGNFLQGNLANQSVPEVPTPASGPRLRSPFK